MQKSDLLGLIVCALLLGGLAALLIYTPKAPEIAYQPVEVTGSSVTVPVQSAGTIVSVSAEVKRAGFVTVHRSMGSAPGEVLGSSAWLTPGTYEALPIVLSEAIASPDSFFVLMFVDDGDQVYEAGIDLPVMSNGVVIKHGFTL